MMMGCSVAPQKVAMEELRAQVEETERAFARTMADRDHEAFMSFLSEEAVFFSGEKALMGKQQVATAWKSLYEAVDAPFSWEPEQVVVLDSGTLALSTGPVISPDGKIYARFTSIWRRQASGEWKVVFDKGCEVCDCSQP
jgi:ketosteroid isomerase-like protein